MTQPADRRPPARARRTHRPAAQPTAPADPTQCRCRPVVVATFRRSDLADVHRRHWLRDGCGMPVETLDVADWGGRR